MSYTVQVKPHPNPRYGWRVTTTATKGNVSQHFNFLEKPL